jgi:hypothetical protein
MFAQVELVSYENLSALLVPREAVIQQQGQPVIFVATPDNKASLRRVRLGLTDERNSEILGGIETGEQVIIVGQNTLRDGANIQIPAVRATGAGAAGGGGAAAKPSASPGAVASPSAKPAGQGGQGGGSAKPSSSPQPAS